MVKYVCCRCKYFAGSSKKRKKNIQINVVHFRKKKKLTRKKK